MLSVSITLPETNIAPENRPSQKETIVFQPSIFRSYVRFGEGSTPWKLNIALKIGLPKRERIVFQPSFFQLY